MSTPPRPTTSVLIPAFNAQDTIERAIRSAMNQTVPPNEIVLGCDGCTDQTATIARQMGAIVVENPKSNGAAARNAAFAASSGEVVFLLDSDDEWLPNKVQSHLAAHSKALDASFVIDPSRRVRPGGEMRGLNGAGPEGDLTWRDMVQHRNWSSGSGISARRTKWEAIGGFNPTLRGLQDVDFLIRMAYFGGPGYRVPDCNTLYHLSEGGISRNTSWGDEMIGALATSCPFMEAEDVRSVRQTIAIRNALVSDFSTFWTHIRWGGVSLSDRRLWKALALVVMRKARG